MSSVAQPLPVELSSPGENLQIPDDCVSYTLRGDAPVTVTITCKGCCRVTGDPHHYCIRHLLEAGMPVCTRKSRCSQCADTDANFWVRYMKSYYGACKNMQPDDFSHHLSVQQYYEYRSTIGAVLMAPRYSCCAMLDTSTSRLKRQRLCWTGRLRMTAASPISRACPHKISTCECRNCGRSALLGK